MPESSTRALLVHAALTSDPTVIPEYPGGNDVHLAPGHFFEVYAVDLHRVTTSAMAAAQHPKSTPRPSRLLGLKGA